MKTTVGVLFAVTMCLGFAINPTGANRKEGLRPPASVLQEGFTPACSNPSFPGPATAIDKSCGLDGSGKGADEKQDEVKNNFCATGTPEQITTEQLVDLQNRVSTAGINFGPGNPATDREPLQQMGEGKLVVFRGYVLNARNEHPETVNCGKQVPNTIPYHDIHITLADQSGDEECSGFVAEMIPHHRSSAWTRENVLATKNPSVLVRVTGQLMFDSSHLPCQAGNPVGSNPARTSLWEIHPIYNFEVCTADCDGEGQWVSLEQWAEKH